MKYQILPEDGQVGHDGICFQQREILRISFTYH